MKSNVNCCNENDQQCSADVVFVFPYIENAKQQGAAAMKLISSDLLTSAIWSFMATERTTLVVVISRSCRTHIEQV